MKQINKNLWIVWGVSMFIWLTAFFTGNIQVANIFAGIAVIASVVNIANK